MGNRSRNNLFINTEYEIHFETSYCIIKSLVSCSYTRISGSAYNTLQRILESDAPSDDIIHFLNIICVNSENDRVSSKKLKKQILDDSFICRLIRIVPDVFFNLWTVCVTILAGIILGSCIFATSPSPSYDKMDVIYVVVWIIINIGLHELGHLSFCIHAGRTVPEMGIKLNFGIFPMFYCKTTDICMASKKDRISTSLAGVYCNAILCFFMALIYILISRNATIFHCFSIAFFFVISNLLPFIKLDGYYILSDLLNIPYLRQRSAVRWKAVISLNKQIEKGDFILLTYFVADKLFISFLLLGGVYSIYILIFT